MEHEHENINVLCMGCGFQYTTCSKGWSQQRNKCPNCETFKSQYIPASVKGHDEEG